MVRIYLDFNATAPLSAAAREAMSSALDTLGNPSSIHAEGRGARQLVEEARDRVAEFAGTPRECVVFTSGGTEANRLGCSFDKQIYTSRLEHPSLTGLATDLVPVEVDDP